MGKHGRSSRVLTVALRQYSLGVMTCMAVLGGCGGDEAQPIAGPGASPPPADMGGIVPPPGTDPIPSPVSGIPCAVSEILATHCNSCHGDELAFGAPSKFTQYDDFLSAPRLHAAPRIADAVLARVRDDQNPMPPAGNSRLSEAQIAVLEGWVQGGLTRSAESCAGAPDDGAGLGLPDGPPEDCQEFYDFRAHGTSDPSDTTPYDVSKATSGDLYQCFNFKVPWGAEKLHGLYFEPLVDEKRVLHHYILYGIDDGGGMTDGSIGCGTASRFRMEGWAPGRKPSVMPQDIGFQMPSGPNAFIQLEVHYNNVAGHKDAVDRSGVRVCTTNKLRKHTAASHWLGTESISIPPNSASDANGVCVPTAEATILRAGPHMHTRGVHMKTVIEREDGTIETLFDEPFRFEDQIQYDIDPPVVVGPKDRLYTTCSFEDTDGKGSSFGPNTADEMCYNFLTAYPAGALVNTGLEGFLSSSFGKNRCSSIISVTPPKPK